MLRANSEPDPAAAGDGPAGVRAVRAAGAPAMDADEAGEFGGAPAADAGEADENEDVLPLLVDSDESESDWESE